MGLPVEELWYTPILQAAEQYLTNAGEKYLEWTGSQCVVPRHWQTRLSECHYDLIEKLVTTFLNCGETTPERLTAELGDVTSAAVCRFARLADEYELHNAM